MEKAVNILSLVKDNSKLIDLCGKTTIKQLAAVAARCDLFIGVDSAPMHIAAALNTPVIALFGPSGEEQWRPWGEGHATLIKSWDAKYARNAKAMGLR